MASRRMISRSLCTSRRYAQLHAVVPDLAEFCQQLFMLLIVTSDDYGRQSGDVFTVKHVVCPTSPRPEPDVERALKALADVGLIRIYMDPGPNGPEPVIEITRFKEHQPGLKQRGGSSKFSPPPERRGNPRQSAAVPGDAATCREVPREPQTSSMDRKYPASPTAVSDTEYPENHNLAAKPGSAAVRREVPPELNRTEPNRRDREQKVLGTEGKAAATGVAATLPPVENFSRGEARFEPFEPEFDDLDDSPPLRPVADDREPTQALMERIAHEVLEQSEPGDTLTDFTEGMKAALARYRIDYDSAAVARGLDSALRQRELNRARKSVFGRAG
jgi:hypothetical protein